SRAGAASARRCSFTTPRRATTSTPSQVCWNRPTTGAASARRRARWLDLWRRSWRRSRATPSGRGACRAGWGCGPPRGWERAGGSLRPRAGRGPRPAAPAGIDPVGWFLHQAASALRRNDARAALANVERLGDLERVAEAEVARPALPALRRLAAGQALA